jgi:hypothetical protein
MDNRKESVVRAGLIAFIGALIILLGVIVVNMAGISVSSTNAARQNSVLWRGDNAEKAVDLHTAYKYGLERAQQWSPDVQLVRAEAAWRPTREGQMVENPPVSWSLYFYSRQERALASASVTGDKVFWVPPLNLSYAPKVIGNLPHHGVEVAWLNFRAAGGDDFLLRHKDAMINFRLHIKDSILVWTVSAFDDRGRHSVMVDARTGIIMTGVQN